jgi:kynurenine formamidase
MGNDEKDNRNAYQYIRISYNLTRHTPVHPDLTPITITPKTQIEQGDDYNTSLITVENHSGTHVDAPAHFLKDGRPIYTYSPVELIFYKILLMDCPKTPDELISMEDFVTVLEQFETNQLDIDCILIRTGFGKYRETDPEKYLTKNPGISPEAVSYLRCKLPKLRCLAIDTVSMSRYGRMREMIKVHQTAFQEKAEFGKPLLFVEDLSLQSLQNAMILEEIMIIPWQVEGIDSAPCTVVAKIKSN